MYQPASGNDSFRFSVSLFSVVKSYPRQRRIGLNIPSSNATLQKKKCIRIESNVSPNRSSGFHGSRFTVGQRIMIEDEENWNSKHIYIYTSLSRELLHSISSTRGLNTWIILHGGLNEALVHASTLSASNQIKRDAIWWWWSRYDPLYDGNLCLSVNSLCKWSWKRMCRAFRSNGGDDWGGDKLN